MNGSSGAVFHSVAGNVAGVGEGREGGDSWSGGVVGVGMSLVSGIDGFGVDCVIAGMTAISSAARDSGRGDKKRFIRGAVW